MPNPGIDLSKPPLFTRLPVAAKSLEQSGLAGRRDLCKLRPNERFNLRIAFCDSWWGETWSTPINGKGQFGQFIDSNILPISRLQ